MGSLLSSAPGDYAPEARALAVEVEAETEGTDGGLSAGAMEDGAPATVGLLDLPDETLVHVYELLAALLHKPNPQYHCGPPHVLPLGSITVNRRIYRLALPVRQQILCISPLRRRPFRDALNSAPYLAQHVRYLEVKDFEEFNLDNLLSFFTSLVTLRLWDSSRRTHSFGDTLSKCKNLRNLDLNVWASPSHWHENGEDPEDFSLEELPSLEKLTLGGLCQEGFFLRNGVSNIKDLTLMSDGPTKNAPMPYSTLSRLHLRGGKGYFRSPAHVLNSFWDATEPGKVFAVKHLVLDVETFDLHMASESETEEQGGYSCEQAIPDLFEILQDRTTSLERLDCIGFVSIWGGETELRLPTIKQLVLEERPQARYNDCGPGDVYGFVDLCPSITAFHLAGCSLFSLSTVEAVTAAAAEPLDPSLPSPPQLIQDEPDLSVLLQTLQKTAVVDFRYRVKSDSSVELRFKREAAADFVEFEGEWWWM
ncbi:hypothetical protein JCM10213_001350 [Rhodosporidiobolus nylandii]